MHDQQLSNSGLHANDNEDPARYPQCFQGDPLADLDFSERPDLASLHFYNDKMNP